MAACVLLLWMLTGLRQVTQGTVAVTTVFGKYKRTLRPGLNFVIPFVEKIYRRISVQNRAVELQFQAITQDQANVYFTAMMVYSVFNEDEETIKNVAFKFVSEKDFLTALVRSVEGSTRGFVATMKQAEILGLRGEIVKEVKENLDVTLETWGYHLIDLQLNDITFDQAITTSMAQVVASQQPQGRGHQRGRCPADPQDQGGRGRGHRDPHRRRGRAHRRAAPRSGRRAVPRGGRPRPRPGRARAGGQQRRLRR